MITEHAHGVVAQAADQPQRLERLRSAVDQVADEPQPVAIAREADAREQLFEFVAAALYVADRPARHQTSDRARRAQCSIPGMARQNAGMGASNWAPSSAIIW